MCYRKPGCRVAPNGARRRSSSGSTWCPCFCSHRSASSFLRSVARWQPCAEHEMTAGLLLSCIFRRAQERKWTPFLCFHLQKGRKPFSSPHVPPRRQPFLCQTLSSYDIAFGLFFFSEGLAPNQNLGSVTRKKKGGRNARFILIFKWDPFKKSAY